MRIVLAILSIKAFIVLLLLVGSIILLLSGADNILFPGLGLVVAVPFIVVLLLAIEIFLVAAILILRRYSSKTRLQ